MEKHVHFLAPIVLLVSTETITSTSILQINTQKCGFINSYSVLLNDSFIKICILKRYVICCLIHIMHTFSQPMQPLTYRTISITIIFFQVFLSMLVSVEEPTNTHILLIDINDTSVVNLPVSSVTFLVANIYLKGKIILRLMFDVSIIL